MSNYAIVGDGATGTTAAFYIRRGDPAARIQVYSDDPTAAYYRAALTNYLMGELRADQLFAVPPNFYEEFKAERVLTRVNGVDSKAQRLDLASGQKAAYDQLLIAAGARATMPAFPGVELSGVMTVRTMQDARQIMDMIASGRLKRAIVVGGGILGLELIAGLATRGVAATWVIRGDAVVSPPLDKVGSDLVIARCGHFGVELRLNEEVAEVAGDKEGRFKGVVFKNSGDKVEAQLLAMSIGITPNIEFLEGSGIETNRGVVVDEHLRTNIPNVYAGGDIAEVADPFGGRPRVIGLWEPARYHGRVAGLNMTGASETWKMGVPYTATRLYDLDVGAVGQTIEEPTDEVEVDFPKTGGRIGYRKLILRDGVLVGALLLGTRQEKVRERARLYRQLVTAATDVSEIRDRLLDPFFDLGAWLESSRVSTDVPRAMATISGPAIRASLSTVLGKVQQPIGAPPKAKGAARQTLSGLMRPVEGLSGALAAPAPLSQPIPKAQPVQAPQGKERVKVPSATLRLEDGRVVTIGDVLTIGRSSQRDLVLDDETVSGNHAEIRRQDSAFAISDLGSKNGTFVDGVQVTAPHVLRHGQSIALGSARIAFIQQALAPRATTGPAGLPAEPLEVSKSKEKSLGRVEWGGRTVEITEQETAIGRDPECPIALDDPSVSWLHAQITRHSDALYLRDLGSSNGSFVNGELVTVPRQLAEGDIIRLGNSDLLFRSTSPARTPQKTEITKPAPEQVGPKLVGSAGSTLGMSFALTGKSLTLGRDPDADIYLKDVTVSRTHARLSSSRAEWILADLGSSNGSFVGGKRLTPNAQTPLKPGDEIKFGEVVFKYEDLKKPPIRGATQKVAAALPVKGAPVEKAVRGTVRVVLELVVVAGPKQGERIPLESMPFAVGRESGPGIFGLDDQFISGRHAEFDRASDGTITVKDLESTNGTKVNGRTLEPHKVRRLKTGDKVQLGPETVVRLEMQT